MGRGCWVALPAPPAPRAPQRLCPLGTPCRGSSLCRWGAAGGRLTGAHLSRRALGVSVTDYTYDDCQLALAEGQLRLPADTCLLEFARLARGLG